MLVNTLLQDQIKHRIDDAKNICSMQRSRKQMMPKGLKTAIIFLITTLV